MRLTTIIRHPDRLVRLAALLERDADNETGVKFDLSTWGAPSDDGQQLYRDGKPKEVKVDCGTTACAFGLAAISGEFKAEGLTYEFVPVTSVGGYALVPTIMDGGRPRSGFSAAQALFGIEYAAAEYLFDTVAYDEVPQGAEGERLVASRIRDFVATSEYDDGNESDDDLPDNDDRPEPADNE